VLRARQALKRLPPDDSARSRLAGEAMVQNKATDVYKFALLVVRILDFGRRRTQNRDPAAAARVLTDFLGADAAQLLRDSLAPDGDRRPDMARWYAVTHGRPHAPAGNTAVAPRREGRWTFHDGIGWTRDAASTP
jgi:hypothetical protein